MNIGYRSDVIKCSQESNVVKVIKYWKLALKTAAKQPYFFGIFIALAHPLPARMTEQMLGFYIY